MFQGILAILVLALLSPLLLRVFRTATGWILGLFPLGIFFFFLLKLPDLSSAPWYQTYTWVSFLNVSFSFYLDGLSLLFGLMISGIGGLIMIYAGGYLSGHPQQGRFFSFLLLFMASMLGVVWADDILTLFVFWELTSVSSFLLIGFEHERQASRDGALQALLVTGLGGLAMLGGLVLMGLATQTWELHRMVAMGNVLTSHSHYFPILLLILAGAFTKSAQFPFHFWLPNAMEAPTPVSAFLHSATMVKAGVYLLARLTPVLGGTVLWQTLLTSFGGVTMLVGAYLALQNTDLKRLLAYSTVSALGIMIFLIGSGSPGFAQAAMAFILAHALYKGALFMVAGGVDHEAGTRDVLALGGLGKKMPLTATAAALAALSMAGFPPFFGFLAKEFFYEGAQGLALWSPTWIVLAVLSSIFLVVVAGMVAIEPFFGLLKKTPKVPHEAPPSLWLGPLLLAVLGLAMGLLPQFLGASLLKLAAQALMQQEVTLKLTLWHGLNFTLLLSGVTLGLGLIFFWLRSPLRRLFFALKGLNRFGPEQWYRGSLALLRKTAEIQTRILQNGYLRLYFISVLLTTIALVGFTLLDQFDFNFPHLRTDMYAFELILMIMIILAALFATVSRSRLGAMAGLGVVGFGVSLAFIFYGAPDLAMTQILMETLVVILLVLGFRHMPGFGGHSGKVHIIRDVIISLGVGALMTTLVLACTQVRFTPTVSEYYVKESLPLAHGRNIVNVILVDFRALDTFGEITVLALAGLGVFSLLKLRPGREGTK